MTPYITRGTAITVFGQIDMEPRVWQDKQGNYRAGIDVTVKSIRLQGGRDSGGQREEQPAAQDDGGVPW